MQGILRLLSNLARDRSAAVATQVAIAVPLLLVSAAATFDVGSTVMMRNKLQIAADSAALAGASALPDEEAASTRALAAVAANMPIAGYGDVLRPEDVRFGNWDPSTRTFTEGGAPLNAVRVFTRRAQANGNALASIFGSIIGMATYDIETAAVATVGGGGLDECLRNGFLADGKFEVGSNVTIAGDTCVHGQGGIKVGSDVVMLPPSDVTYGTGSEIEGLGNSGNVISDPEQENKEILASGEVAATLDAIRNNTTEAPQPNWGQDWTVDSRPTEDFYNCNPADFTLYIRRNVDLSSCSGEIRDFAVYGESIKLPSGSSGSPVQIRNMYFASNSWIDAGSNLDIGDPNFCNSGLDSSFFIARNWIKFGSDIRMWGVQVISGSSGPTSIGIEFGDDYETTAVAAWSDGFLKLGSTPNVAGETTSASCERDEHVLTHTGDLALRLVD